MFMAKYYARKVFLKKDKATFSAQVYAIIGILEYGMKNEINQIFTFMKIYRHGKIDFDLETNIWSVLTRIKN